MRAATAPYAYADPHPDAHTHPDTDAHTHPDTNPDSDSHGGEQDANPHQDVHDRPATSNDHAKREHVEFERDEVRDAHQVGDSQQVRDLY